MTNKEEQLKVTRTGRIMRKLKLFEVIELAEKEWEKPYKNGEFEYGKGAVMFMDRECNSITYVIHNIMPMPYQLKGIEPSQFDRVCRGVERTMKEQGITVIKSRKGTYVDAPEDVKEEVKKQMKIRGYKTTGLK